MAGFRALAAIHTTVEHGLDLAAEIFLYRPAQNLHLLGRIDYLSTGEIGLWITFIELFAVMSHTFTQLNIFD